MTIGAGVRTDRVAVWAGDDGGQTLLQVESATDPVGEAVQMPGTDGGFVAIELQDLGSLPGGASLEAGAEVQAGGQIVDEGGDAMVDPGVDGLVGHVAGPPRCEWRRVTRAL